MATSKPKIGICVICRNKTKLIRHNKCQKCLNKLKENPLDVYAREHDNQSMRVWLEGWGFDMFEIIPIDQYNAFEIVLNKLGKRIKVLGLHDLYEPNDHKG